MSVRVEGLCKAYEGQTVLRDVTFTAEAGRVTCIRAPSGFGKTTLLRLLLGLEKPESGAIHLPENCRWAAVFQEDRLLPQLDAMGNLRFVLGDRLDRAEAETLLADLGLGDVGDKRVADYSGGMRRRLALARALLAPFDALALDEPFTGLDEDNRRLAWAAIRQRGKDRPVLLVTHEGFEGLAEDCDLVQLK